MHTIIIGQTETLNLVVCLTEQQHIRPAGWGAPTVKQINHQSKRVKPHHHKRLCTANKSDNKYKFIFTHL
jgi:hypothetical protein